MYIPFPQSEIRIPHYVLYNPHSEFRNWKVASLEDLKAAQKDLLEAKDLGELKAAFKRWRRIGWKNVCGASIGNVRDIQKLNGRRHPGHKRMIFDAGVSFGLRKGLQNS